MTQGFNVTRIILDRERLVNNFRADYQLLHIDLDAPTFPLIEDEGLGCW